MKQLAALLVIPALLPASTSLLRADIDWPQEITADQGTIVIYQPQPEKLAGNILTARAAMALELKDRQDPIFGAFWFEARLDTDTDARTVQINNIKVTRVGWPDSTDAGEQLFTRIVESAVPDSGFEISLERLSASLETAEIVQRSLTELKNDPPVIIFRQELAVLLLFDGAPRFSRVENSNYERALNTPLLVVRSTRTSQYHLGSGAFWYRASDPLGPWAPDNSPPRDLVELVPDPDPEEFVPEKPPVIVTATEPTEVISTDGSPRWASLAGGELLYVQNTESPWLVELSTGNMYLLLAGRWFRSKREEGPWIFARPDQLPASFSKIPPASEIGGLRVSVAGTDEAEDAMVDAYIPQTAAIKRDEAKLEVIYDGDPQFEDIAGTEVAYAVNTATQVLHIGNRYYAVDDAVWFVSDTPKGPWAVADSIPEEEIQKIPPSAPVYNVTHVHVYQSTPQVVYVGYTPGYMWSFPYYGVPVWGTGFYYPPWYGPMFFPRPFTFGFHVGYNPWMGWSFGMSWSNGFFSFGMSWGGGWAGPWRGGWYGGGFRRPVVINTGNINIGNNISVGNRNKINNRIANRDGSRDRANIYNRPENRSRNADRAAVQRDRQQARASRDRPNNVYADRNGNIARRNGEQWESRQQGSWRPEGAAADRSRPQTRERTPSRTQRPPSNFDRSSFERSHQNRQRGMSREMRRPSRGGGGRRRP